MIENARGLRLKLATFDDCCGMGIEELCMVLEEYDKCLLIEDFIKILMEQYGKSYESSLLILKNIQKIWHTKVSRLHTIPYVFHDTTRLAEKQSLLDIEEMKKIANELKKIAEESKIKVCTECGRVIDGKPKHKLYCGNLKEVCFDCWSGTCTILRV